MLGIYCRISVDRKNQVSIEVQETAGIEFAEENGFQYEVYIDKGISGRGAISDRPSYAKLLEDLESGKIDKVYLYERSRNDRNISTWVTVADYLRNNSIPLYLKGKLKDLTDLDTYYQLVYSAVEQQKYADETSEKIKDALLTNARKGRAFSINPYGYRTRIEESEEENKVRKYLEVDEEEANVVKDIFKMSLEGIGTDSIALKLRERGVPTRKGGKWSGKQVQDIIKNPIHKGERRWQGKTYPAPHIFESEYWDKVNTNLNNNRNSGEKQMKFNYLLKGITKCAVCGRNYYGRTRRAEEGKKPRDHYYMCSSKRKGQINCGNRSIGIDKLERLVWSLFEEGVLKDKLSEFIDHTEKEDIREGLIKQIENKWEEIKKIDRERSRLTDLYVSEEIKREEYSQKNQSRISKKEVLTAEINRLEEHLKKIELRRKELDQDLNQKELIGVSFKEKKKLVNKYIDNIRILSVEKGAHYVGVNIAGGVIALVYHVSSRGKISATTVGWYKQNKEIFQKLSTGQENLPFNAFSLVYEG